MCWPVLSPLDSECQCYVHTAAIGTLASNSVLSLKILFKYI